jgi:antitoxin component YwqK of YwqJK toxin-antitoxin module
MEHQALFRNKLILIIVGVGFFGCQKTPENPTLVSTLLLNKDEQQITTDNGLLIVNNKPFTGTLFSFIPATNDTSELMSYAEGREHGVWKKFYSRSRMKEKRFFEHGQKTREYIAWWENGRKQLHYFFIAGEYEGTCSEWNIEGRLIKAMNYKKGHEEGHQQWWYDNGKIKANYVVKDGRRYGLLGTKNCINVSDSVFGE